MRNLSKCAGMLTMAVASLLAAACQKHSHVTTHSYEYHDSGRVVEPQPEPGYERPSSDYQMTSPGQMSSPGEMVPPGRPVVEPRRNP